MFGNILKIFLRNACALLLSVLIGIAPLFPSTADAAETTWDFSNSADYTYDTDAVEVTGGAAALKEREDWYDTSWSYRKALTVESGSVGSGGVTDFPVFVDVAADGDISSGMQEDGDDLVFTTSNGTTTLDYDLERNFVVAGNGFIAGQQNTPSAIRVGDYTYVGYITRQKSVTVMQYNHVSGAVSTRQIEYAFDGDDHSHPALFAFPNGQMMAVYSGHNGTLHYSLQATPGDNTSWTAPYDITAIDATTGTGTSYAQLAAIDDTVYLVFRQKDWTRGFATTTQADLIATPGADAWSSAQTFLAASDGDRPYTRLHADGENIHFIVNKTNPGDGPASLYYARWDGTTFYDTAGNSLGSAPLSVTSIPDKIWDYSTDGTSYYSTNPSSAAPADVRLDDSGKPVALFRVTVGSDNYLWHARWDGSEWDRTELADGVMNASPSTLATATARFDPSDTDTVYMGTNFGSGQIAIYRITTGDNGQTWSDPVQVSRPNNVHAFYPVEVENAIAADGLKWLWNVGNSVTFDDYTSQIHTEMPVEPIVGAHVKTPSLSSAEDTTFYVYYGNSDASDQSDSSSTWSERDTVLHLQRSGLADYAIWRTKGSISSSFPYGYKTEASNASNGHTGPLSQQSGKIGGAQQYSSGQQTFNSATTGVNINGASQFSISAWFKTTLSGATLVSSQQTTGTTAQARLGVSAAAASGQTSTHRSIVFSYRDNTATLRSLTFTFSPAINAIDGNWHHAIVTFDAGLGTVRGWLDGQPSTNSLTISTPLQSGTTPSWGYGSSPHGGTSLVGTLDEVKIWLGDSSDAFALTEYNNQNSTSTFYTLGSVEQPYHTSAPSVTPVSAQAVTALSGFNESATKNGGEIKYQLSNDGGSTWYWYDGGWTATSAGYDEANTASDIDSNISTFPVGSGQFLFRAYLSSDGANLVSLSSVTLEYSDSSSSSSGHSSPPISFAGSGVSIDVSSSTADISWKSQNAARYELSWQRDDGQGDAERVDEDEYATDHEYMISDLEPFTKYSYSIRMIGREGQAASHKGVFTTLSATSTEPEAVSATTTLPTTVQGLQELLIKLATETISLLGRLIAAYQSQITR